MENSQGHQFRIDAGAKLGSYQITREIGRGGMGVVYLGRDTRLDRDVAIKALPGHLARDPDRLARFEREAKTLAQLNHPNVAGIHGVEEHEGARYLVLEYVEGETLAARLDRGPFAVDEALEIAVQIAAGVEAAHEAGVIHRDLKPGNVIVTPEGKAKVLDFGLARAEEASSSSSPRMSPDSPTVTTPAVQHSPTMPGVILGTAAYMSPEQARGRKVDKRTDIWSFAVILYEMLTGASPFGGDTVSDSIGAVLHKEIDVNRLPNGTPPGVRAVLRRCLQRDRNDRFRDIGDVAIELREAARHDLRIADVGDGRKPRIPVAVLAAMVVLTFGLGWIASTVLGSKGAAGSAASQVIFADIAAPPNTVAAFHDGFALSPDGRTLAFAATDTSGRRRVWTRKLDVLEAQPVPGTDGGSHPTWAPDGASLAFVADGELRRVPANGGQTLVICEARQCTGSISWSRADVILFSHGWGPNARISKVAATGGQPVVLEDLGRAGRPQWLADGKRFLYQRVLKDGEWELRVGSLVGGESVLVEKFSNFEGFTYSAGFVILNRNDALTVQRFDEATGQLVGSAAAISGVGGSPKTWFAVSAAARRLVGLVRASPDETGDPGDPRSRLEWVGRDGEPVGVFGPPGRYWTMRLSPDGRRVAANQGDTLWGLASSGRQMRVSSGAESYAPVWTPDGTELISLVVDLGPVRQLVQPGSVPSALENAQGTPLDMSPDGRWLVLEDGDRKSLHGLGVYDMRERTMAPWLATEFDETQARFSPDGRWVAYVSDVGGRHDVYVRSFEGDGPPVAVSTAGGTHPLWRGDGGELFYLSPDGAMMATEMVTTEGGIEPGRPMALFRRPLNDITIDDFAPYDVAPDGQRFLLNVPDRPLPLLFVQGWDTLVQ